MKNFNIMVMRVILGVFFAVMLTRFFYGSVNPAWVAGLAVFLIGMSYVTEFFRNRKHNK
ncbi:MAG: hypothetical protein LJE94_07535 [Deltaproteobacteria bacterium]|nr:hypothetical protein [Deltaproteobacteria bacterium]